ncbi:hypothetical protein B5V02_06390 [Mesorhizobium kowhaii]|uniref:Uncharacterized protein n=1 Tax=Mesorhizobium kowhaii TaxID=1300272 RepID=A0A2W7E8N8_9HYPH|nr:hypothetical protein B5V02_06390 [Mesorhizobium kowhaii]
MPASVPAREYFAQPCILAGHFTSPIHAADRASRQAQAIDARPAVKRGRMVNRGFGEPAMQLHERYDAGDFETKTPDKLAAE